MSGPAVTVILPTFQRPDALARVLSSLASQEDIGVDWELVVVDNDDPPGAEAVVHALAPAIPAPVTVLHEPNRGATYARNTGIEAAKGDIVVFIDDDVVAAPSWLRALTTPVREGTADAAGGRVELDASVVLPRWLGPDWLGYLSAYDRGPAARALDADDYVLTASAAFRTERLRAIGGFDAVLGPRPGSPMVNDDIDLCRRFAGAGGRIFYAPDAVVVHEVPPSRTTIRYLLRRAYAQGRSDWLLEREHNIDRPLGGAQGMAVHTWRLLGDRVRDGLWRPDAAAGAAASVSHLAGFLREAASNKIRGRSRSKLAQ